MLFSSTTPRINIIELHGPIGAGSKSINMARHEPMIENGFDGLKAGRGDAVVLDINSPGGSPVESALIASRIARESRRTKVPVTAVISEYGASGGYWLACAADRIVAHPMSIVGSIGVVAGGFGFPNLIEKLGVERRLYTVGECKARNDPFKPEDPQSVSELTETMEEIHAEFQAWVIHRRGDRLGTTEDLFNGKVWTGRTGERLGLVDELGDVDGVCSKMSKDAKVRRLKPKKPLLSRLPIPGLRGSESTADAIMDALAVRLAEASRISLTCR